MNNIFRNNWLEVDLDVYAQNVRALKSLIGNSRLCAVVKADAYGHGAVEISAVALKNGADMLAVALVEEGIVLRENGIMAPILLLSEPEREGIREAVNHNLILTLYTGNGVKATAEAYRAFADTKKPCGTVDTALGVHVKIDTGMHRVGVSERGLPDLLDVISSSGVLKLVGFWSHLAVADDLDNPFTELQLKRFYEAYERIVLRHEIKAKPGEKVLLHIANSAGAIYHKDTRLDMVRSGIALYGYLPSPSCQPESKSEQDILSLIKPVLSWKTKVHLTRVVKKGDALSYGLLRPLEEDSLVAVIPAGYHDGISRALFRVGCDVLIGGKRRPIAGQVTMDQIIVDCGRDGDVMPGDEAVILGKQGNEEITAQEWAEKLDTISYEIVCGIGPRVPRLYLQGSR